MASFILIVQTSNTYTGQSEGNWRLIGTSVVLALFPKKGYEGKILALSFPEPISTITGNQNAFVKFP